MRVAVGTVRRAKVEAVRLACERLAGIGVFAKDGADVIPVDVPSGVAAMPMSEEEGIAGARNRARRCWEALDVDVALGLEGGVVVIQHDPAIVILRNWAVAWNGRTEWIGSGPGIQLPARLANAVLDGIELGDAIDVFAGERDIRSGRGTFGVLTVDVLDRSSAFADAVVAALAPWYNPLVLDEEARR
ncbi:MAG: DUF84 family protein [Acidobacteria bacterium]|nr:DUF84 family protein [Acidobacteriota bacterium]